MPTSRPQESTEEMCEACGGAGDEEVPFSDSLDYGPRYRPCSACNGSGCRPALIEVALPSEDWVRVSGDAVAGIWRSKLGATREVPVSLERSIASRALQPSVPVPSDELALAQDAADEAIAAFARLEYTLTSIKGFLRHHGYTEQIEWIERALKEPIQ